MMWYVFAALQQMGFRFSPEFVKFLITKSDLQNHKQMSVDQFIVVCVQIQKFTGEHHIRYVDCLLIGVFKVPGVLKSPYIVIT
jgi:hypothetical protein